MEDEEVNNLLTQAKQYYRMGDLRAVDLLKHVLELDPKNLNAYIGLAMTFYYTKDFNSSRTYALQAIKLNINSYLMYQIYEVYALVLCTEQYKNYETALQYFDKALEIRSDDSKLLTEKGNVLLSLGKYDEALNNFDKAFSVNGKNYSALLGKAKAYIALKKNEEAASVVKNVLDADPNNPEAKGISANLSKGIELTEEDIKRGLADFEPPIVPKENFSSVAGMTELKETLKEYILYPLQRPELAKQYGVDAGGGILLYGPPGCGKTFITKATAGEAKVNFLNVNLSETIDMWVGNTDKNIHNIFDIARKNAPCI